MSGVITVEASGTQTELRKRELIESHLELFVTKATERKFVTGLQHFSARDAFVRMNRRTIAMMFVRLFVWNRRAL